MMQQRGIKWNLDRNGNTATHKHLQCSSSAQLNVDAIRKKKEETFQNFQRNQMRASGKNLPTITWRYKVVLPKRQ